MKTAFSYFNTRTAALLLILCGALLSFSCSKKSSDSSNDGSSTKVTYSSTFKKSKDDVVTSATGTLTATFEPATKKLSYTFSWQGLSAKAIEMHIHDGGPIIIPITGFPMEASGTFTSSATLTADQAADLAAGKLYVQIHTENFPGGEIIAPFTISQSTGDGGDGGDGGGGYDDGY